MEFSVSLMVRNLLENMEDMVLTKEVMEFSSSLRREVGYECFAMTMFCSYSNILCDAFILLKHSTYCVGKWIDVLSCKTLNSSVTLVGLHIISQD